MQLSMNLRVPIMAGEPAQTKVFSTKSGAKRIF
jgi:IQ domain-containing protein H